MTQTDLVNQALSFLKYPTLISSIDDLQPLATSCRLALQAALPEVIDELRWQECLKRVTLPAFGAEVNGVRQFRRPTDLVRAISPDASEFITEGNFLFTVTAEETLHLLYLYLNDNPGTWGPTLQRCVRLRVMAFLAMSLLGNPELSVKYEQDYEREVSDARRSQSLQNTNPKTYGVESAYTDARRSGLQGFGAYSGLIPEPE